MKKKILVVLVMLLLVGSVQGFAGTRLGTATSEGEPATGTEGEFYIFVNDQDRHEQGRKVVAWDTKPATKEKIQDELIPGIGAGVQINQIKVTKEEYDRVIAEENAYYSQTFQDLGPVVITKRDALSTVETKDNKVYTVVDDETFVGDYSFLNEQGTVETARGRISIKNKEGEVVTTYERMGDSALRIERTPKGRFYSIQDGTKTVHRFTDKEYAKLFETPQITREQIPVMVQILKDNNALGANREGSKWIAGDRSIEIKDGQYVVTRTGKVEGKPTTLTETILDADGNTQRFENKQKGQESTWVYEGDRLTITAGGTTNTFTKDKGLYYTNVGGKKLRLDPETGYMEIETKKGSGKYTRCRTECQKFSGAINAGADAQKPRKPRESGRLLATLANVLEGYREYSGLGFWTGLFTDDEEIAKKKKELQDKFCDYIILGGTQCWTSKICEAKVDGSLGGRGIVSKTSSGTPKPAAHIEAERSEPIQFYNESLGGYAERYLYRISYSIHNPNEVDMSYTVTLIGPQRTYNAFTKTLAKGASARAVHSYAIAKYSNFRYDQICLNFNPGIERIGGGISNSICNGIVGQPIAVAIQPPPPAFYQTGTPSPAPTRPDWEGF